MTGRRGGRRMARVAFARTVTAAFFAAVILAAFAAGTAIYMRSTSGDPGGETPLPDVSDGTVPTATVANLPTPFKANLSEFEMYMEPGTDEYLFLVNNDNTLAESYIPTDLVAAPNIRSGYGTLYMREYAAKALQAMMIEAKANGFKVGTAADGKTLSVISAYRSYAKQKNNFNNALNGYLSQGYPYETAYRMTCEYYALPGSSEHQTGLCCDITTQTGELNDSFADTAVYKWLSENAHRFGFILRYPNGKEDSTGIKYEPWHYRYVGRKYATEIYESGLTLEEYMAQRS